MRIVAAYLMAVLGWNDNPDKAAVTKILDSVGAKADDVRDCMHSCCTRSRLEEENHALCICCGLLTVSSGCMCLWRACAAQQAQLEKVLSELKGKDLDALIAEGSKKLSEVPTGGAAPAAGGAAAGAAPAAAKKEEPKKKSSSEESAGGDMGFSLFD